MKAKKQVEAIKEPIPEKYKAVITMTAWEQWWLSLLHSKRPTSWHAYREWRYIRKLFKKRHIKWPEKEMKFKNDVFNGWGVLEESP